MIQIGDKVKRSMSNTLINYYDVDLHRFFNREVTKAWNKAQQRVNFTFTGETLSSVLYSYCMQ